MRWSKDGYIVLDDTIFQKSGVFVPGICRFYDYAEGDTVWDQDLIYVFNAFYSDDTTVYLLTFCLYEQQTKTTKPGIQNTISHGRLLFNSKKR